MFRIQFLISITISCFLVVLIGGARTTASTNLIQNNSDDGTEINDSLWCENGYIPGCNYLGRHCADEVFSGGFRFHVESLDQGQQVAFARLRFGSLGSNITSLVKLLIEGVLQESPTCFSQSERPSQKNPKTIVNITWEIDQPWLLGSYETPRYYLSPNVAPIINEILAQPGWGTGSEGKTLAFTIIDDGSPPDEFNALFFKDYWDNHDETISPVALEVYETTYDAFVGRELLGRIQDTSAMVNLYSLIETDTYIEYGTSPGVYTATTSQYLSQPANRSVEISLLNLTPDTRYYYRLCYRKSGEETFQFGPERSFFTQRSRGSSFIFAVNADEHLLPEQIDSGQLYERTLQNIAANQPDFLISLGDFAQVQLWGGMNAVSFEEAKERYLNQRHHLNDIAHSIPFYLAIGNHEGEQGWYYDFENPGTNDDSLAVIATRARKELIPNPQPDGFYTGNSDSIAEYGLRENYFAWEWGDALFVVLDPFWYTKRKPHPHGPGPGSYDGWDWTLGKD